MDFLHDVEGRYFLRSLYKISSIYTVGLTTDAFFGNEYFFVVIPQTFEPRVHAYCRTTS
ncbi:hypothetical protein D3C86_1850270 [compost metagenome]